MHMGYGSLPSMRRPRPVVLENAVWYEHTKCLCKSLYVLKCS